MAEDTIETRKSPSLLLQATDAARIRLLVSAGTDVNAVDENGNTALHLAACRGDVESIEILWRAGAAIDSKNAEGQTPLHLALNGDMVRTLINVHADPEEQDNNGRTPLLAAVERDDVDVIQALIEAGASTCDTYDDGCNLLHIAVSGQPETTRPDVIKVLYSGGVDLHETDDDGLTPLDFAAANGNTVAVDAILSVVAEKALEQEAAERERAREEAARAEELAAQRAKWDAWINLPFWKQWLKSPPR